MWQSDICTARIKTSPKAACVFINTMISNIWNTSIWCGIASSLKCTFSFLGMLGASGMMTENLYIPRSWIGKSLFAEESGKGSQVQRIRMRRFALALTTHQYNPESTTAATFLGKVQGSGHYCADMKSKWAGEPPPNLDNAQKKVCFLNFFPYNKQLYIWNEIHSISWECWIVRSYLGTNWRVQVSVENSARPCTDKCKSSATFVQLQKSRENRVQFVDYLA